jgi:predicted O-methyltransferase YrrM
MISKLANALTDPHSFWREVFRYGYLAKPKQPQDWLLFRHTVGRECAIRREPMDGPARHFVEEIFPDVSKVISEVVFIRPNVYNVSWEEIVTLSQLVRVLRPRTIFEFGTFDGRTTLHFAINTPGNTKIYTLDIGHGFFEFGVDSPYFNHVKIGKCFHGTPAADKIVMLTGDSRKFDFTLFMKSIDFIFIDADHSYDSVMNDSYRAFELISPSGVVVWHDYLVIDEVTRAIVNLTREKQLTSLKGTSLVLWKSPECK